MHDWVYFHADRVPDRAAVLTQTLRLTYGELARRIRLMAGLLAATGIRQGDRVMLALPNTPATVVAALAVNAIGAASVEVSRTWSAEVLAEIVARSGVRHAFVWERDAPTWIKVLADRPIERLW